MEKKVSRIERQQTTIIKDIIKDDMSLDSIAVSLFTNSVNRETVMLSTCLVSCGQLIAGVFLVVFVIELGNGQFKDNSKNQALPTPWPDKVS